MTIRQLPPAYRFQFLIGRLDTKDFLTMVFDIECFNSS